MVSFVVNVAGVCFLLLIAIKIIATIGAHFKEVLLASWCGTAAFLTIVGSTVESPTMLYAGLLMIGPMVLKLTTSNKP